MNNTANLKQAGKILVNFYEDIQKFLNVNPLKSSYSFKRQEKESRKLLDVLPDINNTYFN